MNTEGEDRVVSIAHFDKWPKVVGFISQPRPWDGSTEGMNWTEAIEYGPCLHMLGRRQYRDVGNQIFEIYEGYRIVRDGVRIQEADESRIRQIDWEGLKREHLPEGYVLK